MKQKRYHWFARENEILLDLDTPEAIEQFVKILPSYSSYIYKWNKLDSITAGHWHVFITLSHKLPAEWRIEASIALGSDIKRANADRARMLAGAKDWQCLIRFEEHDMLRKPDLVCLCPMIWKGERLRACSRTATGVARNLLRLQKKGLSYE